jgi:hypothetical protein
MAGILLLGTITLLALTGYAWWQMRASGEVFLSWRCPHCDKGLRYPSSRAGRTASCPACKRRLTVPTKPAVAERAGGLAQRYSLRRKCQAGPAGVRLTLRPAR